mmetsp:Transcript_45114/g.109778  ORF Transcript_45114/g.109778 Transcript_45114/m.109778 type:complete len:571 (+) Transcript_45114:3498-5210(+)
MFREDEEQKRAFESIVCAFLLEVHRRSNETTSTNPTDQPATNRRRVNETNGLSRVDQIRYDKIIRDLENVNKKGQYIVLLHGPGGTGKSHVIKHVITYAQKAMENMNVVFNKRTIVVTAITGSAAVSIRGETTCGAACLKSRKIKTSVIEDYANTYMFICDEISFGGPEIPSTLNRNLNVIREKSLKCKYGNLPIVYAGDFTQLKPVMQRPLYLTGTIVPEFHHWVHTMIELKTNHRFSEDPNYGDMMLRCRGVSGLEAEDVAQINTRVMSNGSFDLPEDTVYVTHTNSDKAAINAGIFAEHVKATHSTNQNLPAPAHTICIRAAKIKWTKTGSALGEEAKDLLFAACSDAHCKSQNKLYDPLLKLYHGRPVSITENFDVANCIANGTMCKFIAANLKPGVSTGDLDHIFLDGYKVRCADVTQIQSLRLEILDGNNDGDEPVYFDMEPKQISLKVDFPFVMGALTSKTPRKKCRITMSQFPINTANARTCHKLQGRTIKNLFISTFSYTGNWLYVCLSRCKTLTGLFLRSPLLFQKCIGMSPELNDFLQGMRREKAMPPLYQPEDELWVT